ncbi:peptide-methionine (S)-S-oxide reductase MsrA [Hirschia litorea]|uniref:Peptide methionine sulfoxide reductase MsrA n=1 Tax=Hirschia litorea TaxID=1199156 RepID=A0ABW2IMN7_9PROT
MIHFKPLSIIASLTLLASCSQSAVETHIAEEKAKQISAVETKTVVFAGGCFWCVESDFDKVEGVVATLSGYSGGHTESPTYKEVSYEDTGHYEVVQVEYDPGKVSFEVLLDYYWHHVDPTDAGGQFCDRGDSYRTAVFVNDAEQREIAEKSKADLDAAGILPSEIVTPILDAGPFWKAEEYHQDYYVKNPLRYKYYRSSCGRDARVQEVWSGADSH